MHFLIYFAGEAHPKTVLTYTTVWHTQRAINALQCLKNLLLTNKIQYFPSFYRKCLSSATLFFQIARIGIQSDIDSNKNTAKKVNDYSGRAILAGKKYFHIDRILCFPSYYVQTTESECFNQQK